METSYKVGSKGEVVEIDESAFGRRKFNRSPITKIRWVVVGIDRKSKRSFLKVVDKRDQNTLSTIISENVQCGTIITDMWKSYKPL